MSYAGSLFLRKPWKASCRAPGLDQMALPEDPDLLDEHTAA